MINLTSSHWLATLDMLLVLVEGINDWLRFQGGPRGTTAWNLFQRGRRLLLGDDVLGDFSRHWNSCVQPKRPRHASRASGNSGTECCRSQIELADSFVCWTDHVCMSPCACMCACTCVRVCVCVCTCVRGWCLRASVCVRACVRMCVGTRLCIM